MDEVAARSYVGAHQHGRHLGGHASVLDLYALQYAVFRVQGRLPELLRVHLTETLEALEVIGAGLMLLLILRERRLVIEVLGRFLLAVRNRLVERRHRHEDMSLTDEVRHEAVQEGQQQGVDVGAIDIRIRHQDDLVVTQLRDVEVVAVALGEAAAEGVDHGLDLRVREDLIHRRLLDVQDLTTKRQDRLGLTVTAGLRRAARRITLDDEDLALLRVLRDAVRELAIRIKAVLRLAQHVRLRLFLGATDLRGLLRTADDGLHHLDVSIEVVLQLRIDDALHILRGIRTRELRLRLALEDRVRELDGDDCGHTITGIRTGEVRILLLQDPELACVAVDELRELRLEAHDMRAPLLGEDVITEAEDVLLEIITELDTALEGRSLALPAEVDLRGHRLAVLIELLYEGDDALRLMVFDRLWQLSTLIRIVDRQLRVKIRGLMQAGLQPLLLETCLLEDLRIRDEADLRTGLLRLSDHRKKPVHELRRRLTALVGVLIDLSALIDPHAHHL